MEDIGKFDEDGLWISENPNGFVLFLERHANKRAVLSVKKWYKKRSGAENAYMHWLFTFIGKELGYTAEDIKGYYKLYFKVPHTKELDTLHCEEFLEQVRQHAQEFYGIRCPLPNEVIYE